MDEQDFELLAILDKTRNITRAADRLYITQSSVSKRIQQIERELGTTIMLRSRQGIHFTPAGEIVLQHVSEAARELETMRQEIGLSRGAVAGTLRAGVSINYSMYRLPGQLLKFQEEYPQVSTQITTNNSHDVYRLLLHGSIDVGILRGEFDWSGEKALLERERVCAITSRQYGELPLESLPQLVRRTDAAMERDIARWMREHGIPASRNQIIVNSTATCVEMARQGLGWGIVPEICLKNFDGTIRPLYFLNGEPLLRSTYIMYPKQSLHLPQVRAFIDLIRKTERKI